ncbi:Protein short hypocotyl in white light 1 [Vitis vinifera]|uniref:Protein short hypocotyl in white light 1 n=1 Tax=Vitis vinifera TaxID=29760 RepID=A0A438JNQ1_VITVI|nr:Protein short hypocotyl in white light 1 [Vitis vinifera]
MMAGLGRLSGLIINLNPTATTKLNLNLTPSPNFTCPRNHFISVTGLHPLETLQLSPPMPGSLSLSLSLSIYIYICCYLSGSAGEAPEEIDESFFEDEDLIESDEEDETESSADLLIKFLQSMFKKASKHAKKASRSVLPAAISPQLVLFLSVQDSLVANFIFGWEVSFAVDGVLILASLSIIKALLEVFCTLGGTVFVVILLLRVIWATVSYFQTSGNGFSQGGTSFGTTQPIT